MYKISDTELIITEEKKIYHLDLAQNQISNDIILVGDPSRVDIIKKKFDKISYQHSHREFKTCIGEYKDKKITVISTGIGTDNIDIVVNELDALVNIDFDTKTIKKIKKSLNIYRIGTSGAIHKSTLLDSFVISKYAIGFDNLAHFYKNKRVLNNNLSKSFVKHTNWPIKFGRPYSVHASVELLNKFSNITTGITITSPGFYAPQDRELRLKPSIKNLNNKLSTFKYSNHKILNFEMETSALYFLGRTLNHNTLTICAILGNRSSNTYSENYSQTMSNLIDLVLEKISN